MKKVLSTVLAAAIVSGAGATAKTPATLTLAAQTRAMTWNGVVAAEGQVFVSGPRWSGAPGPAVARIDGHGNLVAYPDAAWNGWRPGRDARHAFVNVNSIHVDGKGSLWAVDTGTPSFGGDAVPGGAKLVQIDLATAKVVRIVPLGPDVVLPGSYVDDIRFHDDFSYSTDAGRSGIIVVDLRTGAMRRVLQDIPATTAAADRPIVVDGRTVMAPDGKPLRIQTDPMEVSPDGRWFWFGTLEGPWSRIETRWLDDFSLSPESVAAKVQPWADIPPTGGTALDANGDFYFSDLADNSVKRRTPDGRISTLVRDRRLHWVDALDIDDRHRLWLPVPQLDRVATFHHGTSQVRWPVQLFRVPLPAAR